MSVAWKTFGQLVLTGAPAAVYVPSLKKQGSVQSANAWNPTVAAVTLNVYLVPTGGSADDATRVHQVSVPAGKSLPITEILNLKIVNPTELFADGDGVTLTLTGAEADA
ncbi:hypothetical protein G3N58_15095 [Paraburkholderia sp. Ac-20342]|uniref:hypothetical protein n=1 Tax=Paraburkholderia sp. Ac-20342 TaxID=2703889 RepID=UPI00197E01BB|nr:hypothetical protein [Paraburkholderia sp. Ac-20342]MBN3848146.1 hypothetical protein [Paraburkholderia sp. Ac-20342]